MTDRELMQKALEDICGAKLCEFNSMSSRVEMIRLMDSAITALRERLAQPETELETYKRLYELRGKALERPCINCGHQPAKIKTMAQPEPIAWVYPEGLEALKSGRPWTAYGENGDGPYPDGVKRVPLYLHNDAVARRAEPPAAESGAGFESLPASPKWQGLTDEEIAEVGHLNVEGERMLPYSFARAIEAKLRGKNT